ncbi:MAG TPA: rhomboid family intramembrane serine protease [Patescibacteria group bacterium]|nr:rhomboid family intramembrane serine protease [Patescibacteria group bacterium]
MLLLPVGDVNDEGEGHHSFVNALLILFCVLVFGYEMHLNALGGTALEQFLNPWMFDPKTQLGESFLQLQPHQRIGPLLARLFDLQSGAFVKMAAAAFFHGSLLHLAGNMLVLWMLGDNVEYVMGHIRYFFFFILCAVLATCTELMFATPSNFEGIIGASGGIFGVAAAYLIYFPRAKINFFYWFFFVFWGRRAVSARFVIALYAISQFVTAYTGIGSDYGRVAVWAHVGGFISGFILAFLFRQGRPADKKEYYPEPKRPYIRTPWSGPDGGSWGRPPQS